MNCSHQVHLLGLEKGPWQRLPVTDNGCLQFSTLRTLVAKAREIGNGVQFSFFLYKFCC
jgi:hypothetical protein